MDFTPTWTALLDGFVHRGRIRCETKHISHFLTDMAAKLDHVIAAEKRGLIDLKSIPDDIEAMPVTTMGEACPASVSIEVLVSMMQLVRWADQADESIEQSRVDVREWIKATVLANSGHLQLDGDELVDFAIETSTPAATWKERCEQSAAALAN